MFAWGRMRATSEVRLRGGRGSTGGAGVRNAARLHRRDPDEVTGSDEEEIESVQASIEIKRFEGVVLWRCLLGNADTKDQE